MTDKLDKSTDNKAEVAPGLKTGSKPRTETCQKAWRLSMVRQNVNCASTRFIMLLSVISGELDKTCMGKQ
jgi:hypothetical protein